MTDGFTAFPPALRQFLEQLDVNNQREWFKANKARYDRDVVDPSLDFISAMAGPLGEFAPRFRALPRRSGGSLMRIYRDTRFSRDKRPYKTNVGIQFRHEMGGDVHAPAYYVHIDSREAFLGVGAWRPAPPALKAIRSRIDERPGDWLAARDDAGFASRFMLSGETLLRPPRGYGGNHPMIDDLKRKSFIAIHYLDEDDPYRSGIVGGIVEAFRSATPFMRFLCRAVGVPF